MGGTTRPAAPFRVRIGAVLTALAFVGTFVFYLALRIRRKD